jgi:hypothetical protein
MDYKKMRDILRCHKIYNIVIKNRKRIVATVCDLIEDVKNNPHVYTINDLIKKHGKSYTNIYNVLKNHKMRDLIKKGSASMADSKLRAEIASFADKN